MIIPTYYNDVVKDVVTTNDKHGNLRVTMTLSTKSGNEWFEIYYYGNVHNGFITSTEDNNEKIVARAVDSGEEILVFDNTIHGYDNMFCISHNSEQTKKRTLKKMDTGAVRVKITVEYSIDYDSEIDNYIFNENELVALVNGEAITWEEAKCDGITWIWVSIIDDAGTIKHIVDSGLA